MSEATMWAKGYGETKKRNAFFHMRAEGTNYERA